MEKKLRVTFLFKGKCDWCDDIFEKRRRLDQDTHFCSNKCQGQSRSINSKNGKYFSCFWCNQRVYRTKCQIHKHVFCSKKCNNYWRKGKIISPKQFLFKKGCVPFNKGKTSEELYGTKRAKELKDINRKQREKNWKDLDYRENQMKSRSEEKLKNFRKEGKKYARSKKNINRLNSIKREGRIIKKLV